MECECEWNKKQAYAMSATYYVQNAFCKPNETKQSNQHTLSSMEVQYNLYVADDNEIVTNKL